MKKIINFIKRYPKRIISSIILIIFIILLGACVYLITLDDAKYKAGDMSSTPYAASTYEERVKFTEEGIRFIYKNKETDKEEEKNSSEMAEIIWNEMIKAGSTVKNYLSTYEELEKLMNAEIITQYPKITNRQVDLNGTVEFERHKSDGTTTMLQYINFDEFNKYLQDNNTNIENYFTLDGNDNLLIGVVNKTTQKLTSNDNDMILSDYTDSLNDENMYNTGSYSKTEYTVSSKSANYKEIIKKYTMPFQYLWCFIVAGDDKGVGLDLADLVNQSKIVISIYDNITTTVNTSINTYNKEKKVNVSATATSKYNNKTYTKSDDWNPANEWKEEDIYTIEYVNTYENNVPLIDITKADVWITDYSKEYTYQASEQTSKETNERDLPDEEYKEIPGNPLISTDGTDLLYYDKFKDKLEELLKEVAKKAENEGISNVMNSMDSDTISTNITQCSANYYIHSVNKHEENISTKSSQQYIAGTHINNPKIKKKTDEEIKNGTGENNFVTILCDTSHRGAREKICTEITSWLFEMLEENPDTVDKVELTKYLLNQVLGRDKFDTDFNFDEFGNNTFNFAGSEGGSLSLTTPTLDKDKFVEAMKAYGGKNSNFDSNFLPYAENIYDWSVAAGVNPELVVVTAKTEGNFGQAGGAYNYWGLGTPNGASHGNSYASFKAGIEAYASSILAFNTGWRAERINKLAAERQAAGVDPLGYGAPDTFSGMQSLYSDLGKHEYGSAGAGGYYYMDPARAGVTKIYATHNEFLSKCQNSGLSEHSSSTAVTTWENGQYTAWQVEGKLKFWNEIFGAYGSLSIGENSNIVQTAKSKLGCPYVFGAKGPDSFDCSGFVYWVYQQQGITVPGSTDGYKPYANSTNEIDWNQAQPGDILIIFNTERGTSSGHAGIYLGNDEYIHAPQTGDVVKISSGAKSKFKHVFRFN